MQIDYAFMDQFSKESSMFVDLKTKKQLDLSGFDATLLKNLTFSSGKLIGVPTGLTNSTFYINQTLADQVGIDDSKQLTWDQLLEEGKKLHDAHSDMYLLNMTVNSDLHDYIFEPYLDNITGKQIVDNNYNLGFTQDQLVKALTYVSNLYTDNVVQPASQTAMIKSGQETTNPLWLNSKIVGLMYLNSMYTTISKSITGSKIAVVDFPSTHGTKNSGIISRPAQMWSINAQSKYSDEAAKFIDYMLIDTQAVKTEGLERSIPAVKSSRDTLLKDGVIDTFFSDSVTFSEKNPSLPQSFVSLDGEIQAIENDILSKVAYKQDTPQQGATEMMSQLKSKITELKASS
jgi:oligogalacturonide transport system substrate-binding protein